MTVSYTTILIITGTIMASLTALGANDIAQSLTGTSESLSDSEVLSKLNSTVENVCGEGINNEDIFEFNPSDNGDKIIFPDEDTAALIESDVDADSADQSDFEESVNFNCALSDPSRVIDMTGAWQLNLNSNGKVVLEKL